MNRILLSISLLFVLCIPGVFAQPANFYYGDTKFNPNITTPQEFFGFEIGSSLVRYDRVVEYFKLLAKESDRASLVVFGHSWQHREQVKLFISTPENQKNLEQIRQEHLKLVDPLVQAQDLSQQKLIFELGYNVHGGEIAGTDAAVLHAYYFIANQEADFERRLADAVVLIEPAQNPDGRERSVTHINGFASVPPVADPADIGHGSSISPHRGNHYWNDLNRDWLPLSQVESQNRVNFYHKWYPNVYLDFHEMGASSTYYFEPSPVTTRNAIVPIENYTVLNEHLAQYFSKGLDSIGSLYFTKESFTNLSPIYGSTYPDYQGGVGVTLEVGGTSGVLLETAAGLRPFSQNLKDNFVVGVAGFQAATDRKKLYLEYQQDFFKSALKHADQLTTRSLVFGSDTDKNLTKAFLDHLLRHNIQVYELLADEEFAGKKFSKGSAYVVPLKQAQFRILQSIIEENETSALDDSYTFYDISAWSTIHGFGVPFHKSKVLVRTGQQVTELPTWKGSVDQKSHLAYAFDFSEYTAPKALYFLQSQGVQTRVSQKPFLTQTSSGMKKFGAGTIIVPVNYQKIDADQLYKYLQQAAELARLDIYALKGGYSAQGLDLGSNQIRVINQPKVAAITSGNWTSLGEAWALLGNTHGIPLTKITAESAVNINLSKYTSILLFARPTGVLADRILSFVQDGGHIVASGAAVEWAESINESQAATGQEGKSQLANKRLFGVILQGKLNLQHPFTFGLQNEAFYTLKTNTSGLKPVSAQFSVLKVLDNKVINGYAPKADLDRIQEQDIIASFPKGRGVVTVFSESPTFRGYWLAPGRILTNAIFFNQLTTSQRR